MNAHEDLTEGKVVGRGAFRLNLQLIAHAVEDLPAEVRHQAATIASVPAHVPLRQRILDELENAALDAYGNLECWPLLKFLSRYPVKPYTYLVSAELARGERPDPAKLTALYESRSCLVTVNLCAEMADGDDPVIASSGLAGRLRTYHLPVVDMLPPQPAQVIALLDLLCAPQAGLTYLHCEAGVGRTGVMTACYRMAVMGWSVADAVTEAVHFGCSVPMQLAFIEDFGALLAGPRPPGRYPLLPPGSVQPTVQQLAATVGSVTREQHGQIQ